MIRKPEEILKNEQLNYQEEDPLFIPRPTFDLEVNFEDSLKPIQE